MAGGKKDEKEKLAPIIIKRVKKGGGGHHGGAWKVAYADFVTAMMAFFLLLWLLNVTTEDQRNAISNYFDPSHPKVSDVTSGAGGILGGLTVTLEGAMVSTVAPVAQPDVPETSTQGVDPSENFDLANATEQQLETELRKKEDEKFKDVEKNLKESIQKSPDLKELEKNLLIDITPEGLRIQIVDDKGRSMFPSGSAVMYPFMHDLLIKVTASILGMPNQVSVRGHTDSAKYRDATRYDNWNLSADRAQASRRVMIEGKLPEKRVENVMGRSDREALDKDPASPRNRRISIILLRERLTQEAINKLKTESAAKKKAAAEEAAKAKAAESGGITIIDDTQPGAEAKPKRNPNDPTPLPVTPAAPDNFKRQPQVLEFNEDGSEKKTGELYEGPAQTPAQTLGAPIEQKGPPRINKKLFDLGDDKDETPPATQSTAPVAAEPGKAVDGAPGTRPDIPLTAPAERKTIDFGDPVPAQQAPVIPAPLPPAAETQILNNATPSKALEFGGTAPLTVTPAAPIGDSDTQLINPKLSPKVLELDAAPQPASPTPATPQIPAPAAPQSSPDKKELSF